MECIRFWFLVLNMSRPIRRYEKGFQNISLSNIHQRVYNSGGIRIPSSGNCAIACTIFWVHAWNLCLRHGNPMVRKTSSYLRLTEIYRAFSFKISASFTHKCFKTEVANWRPACPYLISSAIPSTASIPSTTLKFLCMAPTLSVCWFPY